jgi:exodeoxyribonuclease V alpha subunit
VAETVKNILIKYDLLYKIDIHFANYCCKLAATEDEQLWLLVALVSYFANQGDSALSIDAINHKNIYEIFNLDRGNGAVSDSASTELIATVINISLDELLQYDTVIGAPNSLVPLLFDNELFYLNRFYQYENTVANFIKNRITGCADIGAMKDELNRLFPDNFTPVSTTKQLVNWQKIAAILALKSKFAVISGGPGTGKTTTVGKILALLLKQNQDLIIKMVAPTGKAADRLNESIRNFKQRNKLEIDELIMNAIPETAETIHRFIGINSRKPKYDKYSPAPIDILLIDEASMVSLPLFAKTFEALPEHCRVILLGDKDQLMAVENGNVLKDITDSEKLNAFSEDFVKTVMAMTEQQVKLKTVKTAALIDDAAVQLEYSWRFKDSIGIGELSRAVNSAAKHTLSNELLCLFKQYESLNLLPITQPTEIVTFIAKFCKEHLIEYKKALAVGEIKPILNALTKFRLLCAVNDGPFGVNEINQLIENGLFANHTPTAFYHGRPILITANDYKLNLMNGDVGVLLENEQGELKACFADIDNNIRAFNPASLGEHRTAFAISIHKSQGSEFDNIFIIMPNKVSPLLTKELIYTAITRAKKNCTIIASPEIFYQAAITRMQRQSGLKKKLMIS